MKNEKVKTNIWDNKVLWIFISITASILLWVYVTTTEGEVIETSFEGVQILFNGEDTIREKEGLVISNASANTVTVKLRATRRVLSKLNSSNISAVVDVSKINSRGNNTLPFTMVYPVGTDKNAIDIVSALPQYIYFYVDKASTKSVEVKGEFDGSVVEGFVPGKITFDPQTVTISGPENEVSKVAYAWVLIQREEVDKTLKFDSEYILVDADGKELELDNIRLETQMVSVTLPITATKEVPLSVDLVDGGGATIENVKLSFDPETIIISGDAETLKGINKVSLGTIDLASFESTLEEKFPIVLDNEVSNVTGVTEAKVTVAVIGMETKKFDVTNISITNVPDGHTATLVTENVVVTLRGSSEVIKKIKANNIRAVIDLSDFGSSPGVFQPAAKISVDGYTGVGAIGEYELYVKIT